MTEIVLKIVKPASSMPRDKWYFVKHLSTDEIRMAQRNDIFNHDQDNVLFLNAGSITWVTYKDFVKEYTLLGEVNKIEAS